MAVEIPTTIYAIASRCTGCMDWRIDITVTESRDVEKALAILKKSSPGRVFRTVTFTATAEA